MSGKQKGGRMDAEQYLKKRPPKVRVSRLADKWSDIKKLRDKGCSLEVIRDFLKENGIETSRTNLHLFIKRQLIKDGGANKELSAKPVATIKQDETDTKTRPAIESPAIVEKKENIQSEQIPESSSPRKGVKYIPPGKLSSMMNRDINIDDLKNSSDDDSEK